MTDYTKNGSDYLQIINKSITNLKFAPEEVRDKHSKLATLK